MKPNLLHQPIELHVSDLQQWKERPLVYHFFEIVQILDGSGTREVNHNHFPYRPGCLFIFTPLDCRGFEATSPTRFCSIRFSAVFLEQCKSAPERERITRWLKELEHIFFHRNRFEELRIQKPDDSDMIASLIQHLIAEYEQKPTNYQENLQHLVTLILNILVRNTSPKPLTTAGAEKEPLINQLIVHIHRHIHCPEKLRIDSLAFQFHRSANYIGEYFKKITGESLQQYIRLYKLSLVQQRLANSNLTVSQIADELGFSHESYLGRQFRKYIGISPVAYRKNVRQNKSGVG